MKIQPPKLPVLSNNFIADLLRYLCKDGWPSPHTVQKKLHPSLPLPELAQLLNEPQRYILEGSSVRTKCVFGSSSKGLKWKTCMYKGKSSSAFGNTDVNQEYAFDSRWCYTAWVGNQGQNRDLEYCQAEAILGWYLFWNPIETIISKFIKPQLQMLK